MVIGSTSRRDHPTALERTDSFSAKTFWFGISALSVPLRSLRDLPCLPCKAASLHAAKINFNLIKLIDKKSPFYLHSKYVNCNAFKYSGGKCNKTLSLHDKSPTFCNERGNVRQEPSCDTKTASECATKHP